MIIGTVGRNLTFCVHLGQERSNDNLFDLHQKEHTMGIAFSFERFCSRTRSERLENAYSHPLGAGGGGELPCKKHRGARCTFKKLKRQVLVLRMSSLKFHS